MKNLAQNLETHAEHGISQFELTKKTIYNLQQFDLTPAAKLVLVLLTTHYNENKNGAVVFPSTPFIAETLGLGLTSVKQAINDLIKEGLIIKSKRDKIRGNYNKYLLTLKVQNTTSEQPENECFKKSECDRSMRTNKHEEIKEQTYDFSTQNEVKNVSMEDFKILKDYAVKHNAKNISAYVNWLIREGKAEDIIEAEKRILRNAKAMIRLGEESIKAAEEAAKNADTDDKTKFFNKIRNLCR